MFFPDLREKTRNIALKVFLHRIEKEIQAILLGTKTIFIICKMTLPYCSKIKASIILYAEIYQISQ